jgi:hypothetical protein
MVDPTAPDVTEFKVSEADMHAWSRHHMRTAPHVRAFYLKALVAFSLLNGLISCVRYPNRPLETVRSLMLAPPVFLVLGIVGLPLMQWLSVRSYLRSPAGRGALGARRLVLEGSGIRETTKFGERTSRWPAIYSISQTTNHIFIQAQPSIFYVVPKAAFETPAHAIAFFERLKAFRQAERVEED